MTTKQPAVTPTADPRFEEAVRNLTRTLEDQDPSASTGIIKVRKADLKLVLAKIAEAD